MGKSRPCETNGGITVSWTEYFATGRKIGTPGAEVAADYKAGYHYTNWKEGGTLSILDVGARLRYQF